LASPLKPLLPLAAQSRYAYARKVGYYATSPVLRKGDPTPENRVWGFFADPNKTRLSNRPQAPELHRKNRLTLTKTASGIPVWPSRDPIRERGGLNLYCLLDNQPVKTWDLLGMKPGEGYATALEAHFAGQDAAVAE
jgi:hypothetical protein